MKSSRQLVIATVALLGLVAAVVAVFVPVKPLVIAMLGWIRGAGLLGMMVYTLAYIATCVCFVPPLLLNTAAGFLWGPAAGLAVVWPANVIAAMASFGIGRSLGREWVARRLEQSRRLAALNRATRAAGLRFVLLLKLSPICPFATLNYVLGTTRMRLRDFLVASILGTLPGTLLYLFLGSLLSGAAEIFTHRSAKTGWHVHLLTAGFLLMAAAIAVLVRAARQEVSRAPAGNGETAG